MGLCVDNQYGLSKKGHFCQGGLAVKQSIISRIPTANALFASAAGWHTQALARVIRKIDLQLSPPPERGRVQSP